MAKFGSSTSVSHSEYIAKGLKELVDEDERWFRAGSCCRWRRTVGRIGTKVQSKDSGSY